MCLYVIAVTITFSNQSFFLQMINHCDLFFSRYRLVLSRNALILVIPFLQDFVDFIGKDIRLDHVKLAEEEPIHGIMEFYMGDNTIERQNFIRANLRSEKELEDIDI